MIQCDGSYTVEDVPAGVVKIGVISRDPAQSRAAPKTPIEPDGQFLRGAAHNRMVPAAGGV